MNSTPQIVAPNLRRWRRSALVVLLCTAALVWVTGCKTSPREAEARKPEVEERRPQAREKEEHKKAPEARPAPAPVPPAERPAGEDRREDRHHAHKAIEPRPAPEPAAPTPKADLLPPAPEPGLVTPKSAKGERGVMNFDPPKTMTLNSAVTVDVAIRRANGAAIPLIPSDSDAGGKYGLSSGGPVQGVPVAVADVMDVELRAETPGAFTITPNDDQRKSIDAGGHAEWHWTVTPLKAGAQKLLLHSMRIRTLANGTELPPTDDDTTVAQINVTVLPWWQRIGPATGKLLADNWKSILAFLLPGGGGAILLAWWQKRKQKKSAQTEDKP